MTITLGPEHEQLIAEALETGAYRNPDEVIGRALEMLHSEDEWLQDQKDLIEGRIERAFAQCERGEASFCRPRDRVPIWRSGRPTGLLSGAAPSALPDFV